MKVNIGPYKNWFGPYQLTDLLQKVGVSEDTCYKLGHAIAKYTEPFFEWIHSKQTRKVQVKIHPYDTWSMDHTLALIIVPMLQQLKATKHGAPNTDDQDVPEHLQAKNSKLLEDDHIDENHFKRWDWILNEMIWAFEQKTLDNWEDQYYDYQHVDKQLDFMEQVRQVKVDKQGIKQHHERMQNGFRLFGKYYEGLWD